MRMPAYVVLALFVPWLSAAALLADEDTDDDYPPGLEARYTAGEQSIEQIDRDLQFVWGTGSPDSRLSAGAFEARWTGKLLIRAAGKYVFHLHLQGDATVKLHGQPVVSGNRDAAGWLHGKEVSLEFGELPLEVVFRKTQPAASLKWYWSSDSFPLEPIPPQVLFHTESRQALRQLELGRELYESARCNRCHVREGETPALPAPSLTHAATGLDHQWLLEWLMPAREKRPHSQMPNFGFSKDEATAVAAFVANLPDQPPVVRPAVQPDVAPPLPALPSKPDASKTAPSTDVHAGRLLFASVGCLACHRHDRVPVGGELKSRDQARIDGGDLSHIGDKRSGAWLQAWLKTPEQLIPDHRMPAFQLSDDERRSLAAFLSGSATKPGRSTPQSGKPGIGKTQPDPLRDPRLIAEGQKLVAGARCAACHEIPGVKQAAARLRPLVDYQASAAKNSCAGASPDRKSSRPAYNLSDEDQAAILAYVRSCKSSRPPAAESPFVQGMRMLRRKNCLQCHERDGSKGIVPFAGEVARLDPEFAGQSESLIPPDLTAVGDKLRDAALADAIGGAPKHPRLPWLRIRMPRFEHTPAEREALLAYLIGHDRIPDAEPPQPGSVAKTAPDTAEEALAAKAGRTLIGAQGFSCIACHRLGDFEPANVALGTRGSDLKGIGDRMRPEFFLRWTRSPLRIIPGMEMPSYNRPVAGLLKNDLDRQLDALWGGLNDPNLSGQVTVTGVEQAWSVAPGGPARIIRDVFNLGTPQKPAFVARAFAIGLNNGHSLLFDLDTKALRDWWTGDFASQRTMGKSWNWEPAGKLHVAEPNQTFDRDQKSRLVLRSATNPNQPALEPLRESGVSGRLLHYERLGQGVRLQYTLTFRLNDGPATLTVAETFFPIGGDAQMTRSGWSRGTSVSGIPPGYRVARNATMLTVGTRRAEALGLDLYESNEPVARSPANPPEPNRTPLAKIAVVPGFDGVRLPLDRSIMPTAITWMADGTLAFCSLKGEVYLARDTDGDGNPDQLSVFEEGLAAPYGIIADGPDLIVSHKPELLRLRDTDGDGRADAREVIADRWGYNDNYHNWTFGIVRDSHGNLYVGLGSDYAEPERPRDTTRWRGKVLRIDPQGKITPVGHAFRYPTGLAINADDQVFVTDNQGVANTFNEINHLIEGAQYGVPSLSEEPHAAPARNPAIQVPHPWTRSVNGIFFLPAATPDGRTGSLKQNGDPFAGHGIGCEYDSRFLVRFTLQRIGETYQGAVYPFSLPEAKGTPESFLGTLCGGVAPNGDIYIGGIHDSGWLGGQNVGEIVRLTPNGKIPLGIREVRARHNAFVIEFTAPVDKTAALRAENYSISGYTRKWQGAYATPDSGRHQVEIKQAIVAVDGLSVVLPVDRLQENYVYEVTCGKIGLDLRTPLWPATGHYTMNQIPPAEAK